MSEISDKRITEIEKIFASIGIRVKIVDKSTCQDMIFEDVGLVLRASCSDKEAFFNIPSPNQTN